MNWNPTPAEPTPEMIDRGVKFAMKTAVTGDYPWPQYIADLYRTMAAAALQEHSVTLAKMPPEKLYTIKKLEWRNGNAKGISFDYSVSEWKGRWHLYINRINPSTQDYDSEAAAMAAAEDHNRRQFSHWLVEVTR